VIDLAVQSGAYQDPSVLDQAFEIIREQLQLEDWMVEQRKASSPMKTCAPGYDRRFAVNPRLR
jgi:hypothetical protein